jgi:hypothetical protein
MSGYLQIKVTEALLSRIRCLHGNKSVAEVGQHKAPPLLAVASGCGPSACNASLMQATSVSYASLYRHSLDSALLSGKNASRKIR